MEFRDMVRRCLDCGGPYVWSEADQRFAQEKGYLPPKWCGPCRAHRKARRAGRLAAAQRS